MNRRRLNDLIQTNPANADHLTVSPDPAGNRAQRRAWKKLTKKKEAGA